jgi:hypothetical protein
LFLRQYSNALSAISHCFFGEIPLPFHRHSIAFSAISGCLFADNPMKAELMSDSQTRNSHIINLLPKRSKISIFQANDRLVD